MTATYDPIATTTADGSVSSITFSSIPATFTDLIIVRNGSNVNGGTNTWLRFNGDSGSNYSVTGVFGNGSSAGSYRETNTTNVVFDFFNSGGERSLSIIQIMNYSNTVTNKSGLIRRNDTHNAVLGSVFLWRNTAAINQVTISTTGGNFTSGSTFTLYGIKAE